MSEDKTDSKPKAHLFQPGQSGNPLGAKHPEWRRKVDSKKNLMNRAKQLATKTPAEFQAMVNSPDADMFTKLIAKLYLEAIENGNTKAANELLNRIIGKPVEQIQHSVAKPTFIDDPEHPMLLGIMEPSEDDDETND